jgi:hypothetical protein
MKNLTSIQLLQLININELAAVKGGANISVVTRSVAGEWWGAGSL